MKNPLVCPWFDDCFLIQILMFINSNGEASNKNHKCCMSKLQTFAHRFKMAVIKLKKSGKVQM